MKKLINAIGALALTTSMVMALPGTAAADQRCSQRTIKGIYGGVLNGFIVDAPPTPPGPATIVGTITFDGRGTLVSEEFVSAAGFIDIRTYHGTYEVGPNCRGRILLVLDAAPEVTRQAELVLVNEGKELLIFVNVPGTVLSGSAKRQ